MKKLLCPSMMTTASIVSLTIKSRNTDWTGMKYTASINREYPKA